MPVAVKICGVRTPEAASVLAEAGADLLGLIFAPSKRQVTAEEARRIVTALRAHPAGVHVTVVGVFVNEQPAQIAALAEHVGFDWAQLSGYETFEQMRDLSVPVVKAVRCVGDPNETPWLAAECDALPVLVDAHVPGAFGGAGVLAKWDQAAELSRVRPVLLAGGLTPENVATAIEVVRPWGVDVSSGVETDGLQDHAKIRAFIRAAKQA